MILIPWVCVEMQDKHDRSTALVDINPLGLVSITYEKAFCTSSYYSLDFHHMTHPLILLLVFIVSALVGYFVIKKIPSLLHTPLMSGMNALSGITVIGAIAVVADTLQLLDFTTSPFVSSSMGAHTAPLYVALILGGIAIVLAMINVVGGFGVTERMLRMFHKKEDKR